ncbi:MAG: dNTP triphosphohydrolase [candidate division KSB1 bacterium]|nr:dNTP triphosphohydrolase [candidate division KSB1 bacterium]MDZ7300863.1 dNTP triphosphohydrolase [candidate division KSB1 bacterium]MDZ7309867.1 dNTP triphosphohydrolase [candidate division KSB1 bacterium]
MKEDDHCRLDLLVHIFDMVTPFSVRAATDWQKFESQWLAPYACSSVGAHATRRFAEEEHPYRTAFQRDRDRIIHSRAFRRLKHKRQVFLITEGDHFRTRLTHTLEVAQIARTMARALGLNEDLVEAIALGHDLGHTPFGHLGEAVLNDIMQGRDTLEGLFDGGSFGGFKHNYQSLRVVDLLEQKYEFPGLNLTAPVREGILKHTRLKRDLFQYPAFDVHGLAFELDLATTLEGQVAAIADEVAQRTHDLEDGLRAGLVEVEEVRQLEIVQQVEAQHDHGARAGAQVNQRGDGSLYRNWLINGLINFLVSDIIQQTLQQIGEFFRQFNRLHYFDQELVHFSPELDPLQKALNSFIYQRIIFVPAVQKADAQVREILRTLFRCYYEKPELLPALDLRRADLSERPRMIADFIAGMTDHFTLMEIGRLRQLGLSMPNLDEALLRLPAMKEFTGVHA